MEYYCKFQGMRFEGSDLLVSRTPLITVLCTEGLSCVNIPFIIIIMVVKSTCIKLNWNLLG